MIRFSEFRIRFSPVVKGGIVFCSIVFFPTFSWGATVSLTNANDSGSGSLRQAITDINTTGDAANTVNSNSNYDITLSSTLPTLNFATTFAQVPFTIDGSLDFNMAAVALTFNQTDTSTFAGNIIGTGASVVKSGTNTLTLTGTSTYTGGTTINGGTIVIAADANLGDENGAVAFGGGTLEVGITSYEPKRTYTMNAGGGTIKLDSGTMTISTNITGAGGLTKLGGGTLVLTGTNSYAGGTTVSVGTLQGDTDSLQGAIANSTFVTFDQATTGTYAGDMSGTGALTKIGDGLLIMTGTNTYSGGTTVSAGGLQGDTDSLQGAITNNTFVTFDQAAAGTYSGVMSGSGSMTKTGAGTLTLSGANTYSGGTTISAGTLQGTTDSLQGNIINNTSLIFNQTTTGTYAGNVSGTGSLTKLGTGTVILQGTNSYTGGTTVTAGTLQGTTRSLQGTITNNSAVVFSQGFNGTYTGTMAGAGTLAKSGTGRATFTGAVTTASTTISGGSLYIDGTLTSPTVTVGVAGDVGGSGTIIGNVTNSGGVSPGDGLGTLTITGNYVHESTATLNAEITPSASDLLTVSGTVTINGGSTSVIPLNAGTRYLPTTTYTVIHANGGIAGTFTSLFVSTPSPLFSASYTYLPNDIQIMVNVAPFSSVVTKGNPGAVARYIDGFSPPAGSDLDFVMSQLQLLGLDDLKDALNQLQPANYKGLIIAQEHNEIGVQSALSNRVEEVYKTVCSREWDCPKRFSTWGETYGDFYAFRGEKFFKGFDSKSLSVVVGGDYAFRHRILLGLLGGYTHSRFSWNRSGGDADIDSYDGGLYGSWRKRRFFLNLSGQAAFSHYKASRKMHFLLLDRTARTTHRGHDALAHLDTGFLFQKKGLEFRPYASLDYLWLHQNDFSESGARSVNLKVGETDYTMLRSEVGFKLANCWWINECTQVIPDFKLGWVYEGRFKDDDYTAHFKESGGSFSVHGLHPNRSLLATGFGVTALLGEGKSSLSLRYDGEFGEDIHNNRAQFEFIYHF